MTPMSPPTRLRPGAAGAGPRPATVSRRPAAGLAASLAGFVLALSLGGCGDDDPPPAATPAPRPEPGPMPPPEPVRPATDTAVAVVHPTEGNDVRGTVTFTAEPDGMRIAVRLTGLTSGEHGFHIHQRGDCSAPDGTSAGGHYDPFDAPHGAPDSERRHVGDLGNLTADAMGAVTAEFLDPLVALNGAASVIGRAVIVHAQPDDFTTQPTGAAGARQGCGVIGDRG